MDYIGEKCAACENVFTADDDIVVCPECGSPHHRECYKELGKCANEELHTLDQKWQRSGFEKKDNTVKVCPVCHFPNTDDRCLRCGTDLNNTENIEENSEERPYEEPAAAPEDIFGAARPYLGFNPEEDFGGATLKEVSQFVGTNTIYYIPIFKRMKDFGTRLSFNISCLFFPTLYFANRKMWGWAVLAAVLSILLSMPMALLYMAENVELPESVLMYIHNNQGLIESLDGICSLADWLVRLTFCLFGNSFYFSYVLNSLRKLKTRNGYASSQHLSALGGIKPLNMVIITIIEFVLMLGAIMLVYTLFNMLIAVNDFSTASLFSLIIN